MGTHEISVSGAVPGPPPTAYDIIADYHIGHPGILPRPPFVDLIVESGGVGEGTVIRVSMRILGRVRTFRAFVTEPEPGRVLREENDTGYITTFTVEPIDEGRRSMVTIATEVDDRGGIPGALERWFLGRLLRPVYFQEIENLATAVTARAA